MSEPTWAALADALKRAKSGLRSDVGALISALSEAELLIPLARDVPNLPEGKELPLSEAPSLMPHVLVDPEGGLHCVLFSHAEVLEALGGALGWTTEGGDLKYCTVRARVALGMALDVIDEKRVLGLVLNPGHESELLLTRRELQSIAQNQALPLVGYVSEIPESANKETLVAEPGDPMPEALMKALAECVNSLPDVASHRLERSFNRERDLEPHPTVVLRLAEPGADRRAIAERIVTAVRDHLPPPGYIDILFDV